MMVRDAAIADVIPKMSQLQGYGNLGNLRGIYNLGHAAFEFMEAKWGKEGVRQFVFALRKSIIGGGDDAYMEAFQITAEEWDIEFDRYLKERFKPFRDKERPADYGRNLAPSADKTRYAQAYSIEPSPSGDLMAAMTGNAGDRELDIVLISTKDGQVIRNLTPGLRPVARLRVHHPAGRPLDHRCRGCRGRPPATGWPSSCAPRRTGRSSSRTCSAAASCSASS